MKKLIIISFAFLTLSLQGCLTMVPVKGRYDDRPVVGNVAGSFEEVWAAVMGTVVSRNMDINVIEKESGLVSSYQSSYIEYTTYEKTGKAVGLIHPTAYIVTQRPNYNEDKVLEKLSSVNNTTYFPYQALTGRWKILVRRVTQDQCEVSVVLGGFEYRKAEQFAKRAFVTQIYSLKNFENEIINEVSERVMNAGK